MVKLMITSRDHVAVRPRALTAAWVSLAGTEYGFGGAVRPETGAAAFFRTDVFIPAPGSEPGGHPA